MSYAHIGPDLGLSAPRSGDTLAFQRFVDDAYQSSEWRTRSLGSAPLDATYDIVFLRVAALLRERNGRLSPVVPVQRALGGTFSSEYELEAGTMYHVKVSTHLNARSPVELPGQGNARLTLIFDPAVVKSVGPTSFRVTSMYDLEYWSFVPEATRNQRSVLKIVCEHDAVVDRKSFVRTELLCPEISLPISVISNHSKRSSSS